MDIQFSYVTSIISAVVFGLEFFASVYVGFRQGYGFPAYYISVACIFGVIAFSLMAALVVGNVSDLSLLPGYFYATLFFSYFQFLMLLFLPVFTVYLLIRHHNQHGGGDRQTKPPILVKALVYIGFFFTVVGIILLITFFGLAAAFRASGSPGIFYPFVHEGTAVFMVLWYFIIFWTSVAPFHRSIPLPSLITFNVYGVLITLPMIISTISRFVPSALYIYPAGQYSIYALYDIPLYFAVALVLINAKHWIAPNHHDNEPNQPQPQPQPQSA